MAGGAKERSSVASEGHMQAHTKRRPVIVGAVALRVVECRCDRRTAAAKKLVVTSEGEIVGLGSPVSHPERYDTPAQAFTSTENERAR